MYLTAHISNSSLCSTDSCQLVLLTCGLLCMSTSSGDANWHTGVLRFCITAKGEKHTHDRLARWYYAKRTRQKQNNIQNTDKILPGDSVNIEIDNPKEKDVTGCLRWGDDNDNDPHVFESHSFGYSLFWASDVSQTISPERYKRSQLSVCFRVRLNNKIKTVLRQGKAKILCLLWYQIKLLFKIN